MLSWKEAYSLELEGKGLGRDKKEILGGGTKYYVLKVPPGSLTRKLKLSFPEGCSVELEGSGGWAIHSTPLKVICSEGQGININSHAGPLSLSEF